ncbi:hypothetical protein ACH4C2_33795 [Streptomyces sp. NPDC018057]|uniref:hypothetical protein n=1 Tax=unclassified Streptomyces TaxID=2593676 RepID=UPI0037B4F923
MDTFHAVFRQAVADLGAQPGPDGTGDPHETADPDTGRLFVGSDRFWEALGEVEAETVPRTMAELRDRMMLRHVRGLQEHFGRELDAITDRAVDKAAGWKPDATDGLHVNDTGHGGEHTEPDWHVLENTYHRLLADIRPAVTRLGVRTRWARRGLATFERFLDDSTSADAPDLPDRARRLLRDELDRDLHTVFEQDGAARSGSPQDLSSRFAHLIDSHTSPEALAARLEYTAYRQARLDEQNTVLTEALTEHFDGLRKGAALSEAMEQQLRTQWEQAVDQAVADHWFGHCGHHDFRAAALHLTDGPAAGGARQRRAPVNRPWHESAAYLDATLVSRIQHSHDLAEAAAEAARDFHTLLADHHRGHPDNTVDDATRKRLSEDFRKKTLTAYDTLWAQVDHDITAWLAHEKSSDDTFATTVTALAAPAAPLSTSHPAPALATPDTTPRPTGEPRRLFADGLVTGSSGYTKSGAGTNDGTRAVDEGAPAEEHGSRAASQALSPSTAPESAPGRGTADTVPVDESTHGNASEKTAPEPEPGRKGAGPHEQSRRSADAHGHGHGHGPRTLPPVSTPLHSGGSYSRPTVRHGPFTPGPFFDARRVHADTGHERTELEIRVAFTGAAADTHAAEAMDRAREGIARHFNHHPDQRYVALRQVTPGERPHLTLDLTDANRPDDISGQILHQIPRPSAWPVDAMPAQYADLVGRLTGLHTTGFDQRVLTPLLNQPFTVHTDIIDGTITRVHVHLKVVQPEHVAHPGERAAERWSASHWSRFDEVESDVRRIFSAYLNDALVGAVPVTVTTELIDAEHVRPGEPAFHLGHIARGVFSPGNGPLHELLTILNRVGVPYGPAGSTAGRNNDDPAVPPSADERVFMAHTDDAMETDLTNTLNNPRTTKKLSQEHLEILSVVRGSRSRGPEGPHAPGGFGSVWLDSVFGSDQRGTPTTPTPFRQSPESYAWSPVSPLETAPRPFMLALPHTPRAAQGTRGRTTDDSTVQKASGFGTDWGGWKPPSDESEEMGGISAENITKFRRVSEETGLAIAIREVNLFAIKRLGEGAPPKPLQIKSKSLTHYDLYLTPKNSGTVEVPTAKRRFSEEQLGLSAFFDPESLDDLSKHSPTAQDSISNQYEMRKDEFRKLSDHKTSITDEFPVVDGVVHGYKGKVRLPITSDIDVLDIYKPSGSPITPKTYERSLSHIMNEVPGVLHGAHRWWFTEDPKEIEIRDKIDSPFNNGREKVIVVFPGEKPVYKKDFGRKNSVTFFSKESAASAQERPAVAEEVMARLSRFEAVAPTRYKVRDIGGLEAAALQVLPSMHAPRTTARNHASEADKASESPYDLSVQECLTLLHALRNVLFPRGIKPSGTADDSLIGVRPQEDPLALGADWQPVDSWQFVSNRVRNAPGTVAFVLNRHIAGMGHAWAAYTLAPETPEGTSKVIWIDLATPERILSERLPDWIPVEARALFVDPSGRVMPLLREPGSASLAAALIDPAYNHQYGANPTEGKSTTQPEKQGSQAGIKQNKKGKSKAKLTSGSAAESQHKAGSSEAGRATQSEPFHSIPDEISQTWRQTFPGLPNDLRLDRERVTLDILSKQPVPDGLALSNLVRVIAAVQDHGMRDSGFHAKAFLESPAIMYSLATNASEFPLTTGTWPLLRTEPGLIPILEKAPNVLSRLENLSHEWLDSQDNFKDLIRALLREDVVSGLEVDAFLRTNAFGYPVISRLLARTRGNFDVFAALLQVTDHFSVVSWLVNDSQTFTDVLMSLDDPVERIWQLHQVTAVPAALHSVLARFPAKATQELFRAVLGGVDGRYVDDLLVHYPHQLTLALSDARILRTVLREPSNLAALKNLDTESHLTDVLEDLPDLALRLLSDKGRITAAARNQHVALALSHDPHRYDNTADKDLASDLSSTISRPLKPVREALATVLREDREYARSSVLRSLLKSVQQFKPGPGNKTSQLWPHHLRRILIRRQSEIYPIEDPTQHLFALKNAARNEAAAFAYRGQYQAQFENHLLAADSETARTSIYKNPAANFWVIIDSNFLNHLELIDANPWWASAARFNTALYYQDHNLGFTELITSGNSGLLKLLYHHPDLYSEIFEKADEYARNIHSAPEIMKDLAPFFRKISTAHWSRLLTSKRLYTQLAEHRNTELTRSLLTFPEALREAISRPDFTAAWDRGEVSMESLAHAALADPAQLGGLLSAIRESGPATLTDEGFPRSPERIETVRLLTTRIASGIPVDDLTPQLKSSGDINFTELRENYSAVLSDETMRAAAIENPGIAEPLLFRSDFRILISVRPSLLQRINKTPDLLPHLLNTSGLAHLLTHQDAIFHRFVADASEWTSFTVNNVTLYSKNPDYLLAVREELWRHEHNALRDIIISSPAAARALIDRPDQVLGLSEVPEVVEALGLADETVLQAVVATEGRLAAVKEMSYLLSTLAEAPELVVSLATRLDVAADEARFIRLVINRPLTSRLSSHPELVNRVLDPDVLPTAEAAPALVDVLARTPEESREALLASRVLPLIRRYPSLANELSHNDDLRGALIDQPRLVRLLEQNEQVLTAVRAAPELGQAFRANRVLSEVAQRPEESALWALVQHHPALGVQLNRQLRRELHRPELMDRLLGMERMSEGEARTLAPLLRRPALAFLLAEPGRRADRFAVRFLREPAWQARAHTDPDFSFSLRELMRSGSEFDETVADPDAGRLLAALDRPASRPPVPVAPGPVTARPAPQAADESRPGSTEGNSGTDADADADRTGHEDDSDRFEHSEELSEALAGPQGKEIAARLAQDPTLLPLVRSGAVDWRTIATGADGADAYSARAYFEHHLPPADGHLLDHQVALLQRTLGPGGFQQHFRSFVSQLDMVLDPEVYDGVIKEVEAAARHVWREAVQRRLTEWDRARLEQAQRFASFAPRVADTWNMSDRVHFTDTVQKFGFSELELGVVRRLTDRTGIRERGALAVNSPLHAHLNGGSGGVAFFYALAPDGFVDTVVYAKSTDRGGATGNDYRWNGAGDLIAGPPRLEHIANNPHLLRSRELIGQKNEGTLEQPEPSASWARDVIPPTTVEAAVVDRAQRLAAATFDYRTALGDLAGSGSSARGPEDLREPATALVSAVRALRDLGADVTAGRDEAAPDIPPPVRSLYEELHPAGTAPDGDRARSGSDANWHLGALMTAWAAGGEPAARATAEALAAPGRTEPHDPDRDPVFTGLHGAGREGHDADGEIRAAVRTYGLEHLPRDLAAAAYRAYTRLRPQPLHLDHVVVLQHRAEWKSDVRSLVEAVRTAQREDAVTAVREGRLPRSVDEIIEAEAGRLVARREGFRGSVSATDVRRVAALRGDAAFRTALASLVTRQLPRGGSGPRELDVETLVGVFKDLLPDERRVRDIEVLAASMADAYAHVDEPAVRPDPRWFPLADFEPASLERGGGVWHFTIDEDDGIRIGSERPPSTPSVTDSAEQERAVDGPARVTGELSFNTDTGRWEVTDTSDRHLSEEVRHVPRPDSHQRLASAAGLMTERFGVPVFPVLPETAQTSPAAVHLATVAEGEEPTGGRTGWHGLDQAPRLDLADLLADVSEQPHAATAPPHRLVAEALREQGDGIPASDGAVLRLDTRRLEQHARRHIVDWAARTLRSDLELTGVRPDAGISEQLAAYEDFLTARDPGSGAPEALLATVLGDLGAVRSRIDPEGDLPPLRPPAVRIPRDLGSAEHLLHQLSRELGTHLRLDVRLPEGEWHTRWADAEGRVLAFDPLDDHVPGTAGLSARQAQDAGLLSPEQRTEVEELGLDERELAEIYRSSWQAGRAFGEAVRLEMASRHERLATLDRRLPALLPRVREALAARGVEEPPQGHDTTAGEGNRTAETGPHHPLSELLDAVRAQVPPERETLVPLVDTVTALLPTGTDRPAPPTAEAHNWPAIKRLLDGSSSVRNGFGTRADVIWLPGADRTGWERAAGFSDPDHVLVFTPPGAGTDTADGAGLPVEHLATFLALEAHGRTPVLMSAGGDLLAARLTHHLGLPVIAGRFGVTADPAQGTLSERPDPDGIRQGTGLRTYVPDAAQGDDLPFLLGAQRQIRVAPWEPAAGPAADGAAPAPHGPHAPALGGPVDAPPAVRTAGVPRAGLPHMPELVRQLRDQVEGRGITVEESVWTALPQRLLSNYRYLVPAPGETATPGWGWRSGFVVPLGPVEALITLNPTDPHTVPNPAGSYDRPVPGAATAAAAAADEAGQAHRPRLARPPRLETIPEEGDGQGPGPTDTPGTPVRGQQRLHGPQDPPRGFRANQTIKGSFATGAHEQTHSGNTSVTRLSASATYGLGFSGPIGPKGFYGGVRVSGTANASSRSTTHIADAETGHVELSDAESTLLAYRAEWSVKLRTESTQQWRDTAATEIRTTGDEHLMLYVPEHYLDGPGSRVVAAGDEVLRDRLPQFHFASGLTGLPALQDGITVELSRQGIGLPLGSTARAELRQKLELLEAHLDEAVNGRHGYPFEIDVDGRTVLIEVHSRRSGDAEPVGATTDKAPVENVRTAIDGVGGSHTLAQTSGMTPIVAGADLGVTDQTALVNLSVDVGFTGSTSDTVSSGRNGLWVVVPRWIGFTSAYEVGLQHTARVTVRGMRPVRSAPVHGRGLVRMPEVEAFRHGFPVVAEALKPEHADRVRKPPETDSGPLPGTVPFAEDALRRTGRREGDPVERPLPSYVDEGKGIGMGLVKVGAGTVEALKEQLRAELVRTGFLPADPAAALSESAWHSDRTKLRSLLDNWRHFEKMLSDRGLESHYDQIHQTGLVLSFKTHSRHFTSDAATITVKATRSADKEAEYRGSTDNYAAVNLGMGMATAGQGAAGSRKLALTFSLKGAYQRLKGTALGMSLFRQVGAAQEVSYLHNRPELLEYRGPLHEYRLHSDYTVTVEYRHGGPRGWANHGARNPSEPITLPGQSAQVHLLPIGDDSDPGVPRLSHTPPDVLKEGVIFFLDATGLYEAATGITQDLTGPQGGADQELRAFTSSIVTRAFAKEIFHGQYTSDQFFDTGFLRDTFAGVDIAGELGASRFAQATDNPFVLGIIQLAMGQVRSADTRARGVSLPALSVTAGDVLNPGDHHRWSLQGGFDVNHSRQHNTRKQAGRTGAIEYIELDFNRAYAFRANGDFVVTTRKEKQGKLAWDEYTGDFSVVKGKTVLYLLSEPEALDRYGRGEVPVSDRQLVDVLNRWDKEEVRLRGDTVAAVLTRWAQDTYVLPEDLSGGLGRPREELAALLADLHHTGALVIRDGEIRDAFARQFGLTLSEAGDPYADLVLPEYLTREDPGGRMLGHSGVHDLVHDNGQSTYDIVRTHVDRVAPGLLAAEPEVWVTDKANRGIGRIQGGVNTLQALLGKGRDQSFLGDLLHTEGWKLHVVSPERGIWGWMLASVVEIDMRSLLTSAPRVTDFMPATGLENYGHNYLETATGVSHDRGVTANPARLGPSHEHSSHTPRLGLATGVHRGVTYAETATTEQTVYDWSGHYRVEIDESFSVRVRRLDMARRPLNNFAEALLHRDDPYEGEGSGETVKGVVHLKVPRGLAEHRPLSGPSSRPDPRPLPELPGDAYVSGALVDDALPAARELLTRMFGAKANGATTRTALPLSQLFSRVQMTNHIRDAVAGKTDLLDGNLFVPGRSNERARLRLTGDFYDLEVVGLVQNTGTGRYSKHQSGTKHSASLDNTRLTTALGDSGSDTRPVNDPHVSQATPGADSEQSRTTSATDAAAGTENYRREEHVKQQGPVLLTRMRFRGRLQGERFGRHLFLQDTPRGEYRSRTFTGDVYVEMFQNEVEELQTRHAAAETVTDSGPAPWRKLGGALAFDPDSVPAFDLTDLLLRATEVPHATPRRLHQQIAAAIRQEAGGTAPEHAVLTFDRHALHGRALVKAYKWAVDTLTPLVRQAKSDDPTFEEPRFLQRYRAYLAPEPSALRPPNGSLSYAEAITDVIRRVDQTLEQLGDGPRPAPISLPPLLGAVTLDEEHVVRGIAQELGTYLRTELTLPDGEGGSRQVNRWAEPSGLIHVFDPLAPETAGPGGLTSAQAEEAGLLTPGERAAADLLALDDGEWGALYETSLKTGTAFGDVVREEIDTRRATLAALDPALPEALDTLGRTPAEEHSGDSQEALEAVRDLARGLPFSRSGRAELAQFVLDRLPTPRTSGDDGPRTHENCAAAQDGLSLADRTAMVLLAGVQDTHQASGVTPEATDVPPVPSETGHEALIASPGPVLPPEEPHGPLPPGGTHKQVPEAQHEEEPPPAGRAAVTPAGYPVQDADLPSPENGGQIASDVSRVTIAHPHRSGTVPYEFSGGTIRLPDGWVVPADGWRAHGEDFVHPGATAYLHSDTGWIERIFDRHILEPYTVDDGPPRTDHTVVAHGNTLRAVPTGFPRPRPVRPDSTAGTQESLAAQLARSSVLLSKQPEALAKKMLVQAQRVVWERNVERPPLPGGTSKADSDVLQTVRDGVAWTLHTVSRGKAEALATAARDTFNTPVPRAVGLDGAAHAGGDPVAGPVQGLGTAVRRTHIVIPGLHTDDLAFLHPHHVGAHQETEPAHTTHPVSGEAARTEGPSGGVRPPQRAPKRADDAFATLVGPGPTRGNLSSQAPDTPPTEPRPPASPGQLPSPGTHRTTAWSTDRGSVIPGGEDHQSGLPA